MNVSPQSGVRPALLVALFLVALCSHDALADVESFRRTLEGSDTSADDVSQLADRMAERLVRTATDQPDTTLIDELLSWSELAGEFDRMSLARQLASAALEAQRELSVSTLDIASTHEVLAELWYAESRFAQAKVSIEQCLDIRRKELAVGSVELAVTLRALGFICNDLRDIECAVEAFEEALTVFEAARPPEFARRVWTLSDLAEMERQRGAFERAETLMREAIEASSRHLSRDGNHAVLLNNLGVFLWEQGRVGVAEQLYREALEITEADAEAPLARRVVAYNNLGNMYREQARYARAEEYLARAVELSVEAFHDGDPDLVLFHNDLGVVRSLRGRWAEAVDAWDVALETLRAQPHPNRLYEAKIRYDLARALFERGDVERSLVEARSSWTAYRELVGSLHPETARGALLVAQLDRAAAQDAKDAKDTLETVSAALDVLGRSDLFPVAHAEGHALAAYLLRDLGRNHEAERSMLRALDRAEQLRPQVGGGDEARVWVLQRFLRAAHDLMTWRIDEGRLGEALQLADRMRARVLRDQITARDIDLTASAGGEFERRRGDARARIWSLQRKLRSVAETDDDLETQAGWREELAEAMRDYREATDQARFADPAWQRAVRSREEPATAERLRAAALGPGEALMFYELGEHESYLFYLPASRGDLQCHSLMYEGRPLGRIGLARMVAAASVVVPTTVAGLDEPARGVAGVAELDGPAPLSRVERSLELTRALVPPSIRAELLATERVLVIPAGAVHTVAMEALATSLDGQDARYWLDEGPIVRYGDSIATILQLGELAAVPDDGWLLTVADATRGSNDPYPALPGTAVESASIAGAFEGTAVVSLLGADAHESAVKQAMRGARWIHLATHGVVDDTQSELLAGLVFSPPPEAQSDIDDGMLNLFELYELPLQCELAVLSACDTRSGPNLEGEGVFALSRGFLTAGSRRTVASLWAVADASTAELMATFFGGIANASSLGQAVDYPRLLRDAKRQVRSQSRWENPWYWAPFVLSGLDARSAASVPAGGRH